MQTDVLATLVASGMHRAPFLCHCQVNSSAPTCTVCTPPDVYAPDISAAVPVKALGGAPLACVSKSLSVAASAEELKAGLDGVAGTAGVIVATDKGTGLETAAGIAEGVANSQSDGVSVKPGNTSVTGLVDSADGDGVSAGAEETVEA